MRLMRWAVLALAFLAACSSDATTDDLAPADLASARDLSAAPDFAAPADFAGCGPACGTADYFARSVAPSCTSLMLQGTVCNQGTVAGATTLAFYFSHDGNPLPAFDASNAMLLCTVKTVNLPPGACSTTGCSPPAGFTSATLPTGAYWLRVNDDGKTFPLATECCTGDDATGVFTDCTLP